MDMDPAVHKYPRMRSEEGKWTYTDQIDSANLSRVTKLAIPWSISIHGANFTYRESVNRNANITRVTVCVGRKGTDDEYTYCAAAELPGEWSEKTWKAMENWAKAKPNHRRFIRGALHLIYNTRNEESVTPAMKAVLESLAVPQGSTIMEIIKLPHPGRDVLFPIGEHDSPILVLGRDTELIDTLGTHHGINSVVYNDNIMMLYYDTHPDTWRLTVCRLGPAPQQEVRGGKPKVRSVPSRGPQGAPRYRE